METLNEIAKLMGCTTWNDGVKLALARLDSHSKFNPPSVPYEVEILQTIKLVNSEEENSFDHYGESLLSIGCAAWLGLSEIDRLDMQPLLVNRQTKYGPNNILAFGYKGIAMRMSDKVARIQNSQDDFEDEAYKDAVMDLVGYCAIAMMLHDGTFHLPVQTSMFGAWGGATVDLFEALPKEVIDEFYEYEPVEDIGKGKTLDDLTVADFDRVTAAMRAEREHEPDERIRNQFGTARHDTCTKQCSLSTFLKRDEEACEDGHCEKQELANYVNDPTIDTNV